MPKVSMFIPCTVDLLLPQVGEAAMLLLKRLGVRPSYHPEQTCCGQPLLNAGYRAEARRSAKHFLTTFWDEDIVVSPSGSCVCMIKQHYPELLKDEPAWHARALAQAEKTFELSQYLVNVLGASDVGAAYHGTVTYHESCHILRGLGVTEQPQHLIRNVRGAHYVALDNAQTCCGFGGEFAASYPDISGALVRDKVRSFLSSPAELLLVSEPGCLLNIKGYLHRHHPDKRVMHLAEFLIQQKVA
ncbi:MAG: (Fe-S)-binding protein [Syntrophaceae bacterium]